VRLVGRKAFADELECLRERHPAAARTYDGVGTFIDLLAFPKTFDTSRTETALGRPVCAGDPLEAIAPAGMRSAAR